MTSHMWPQKYKQIHWNMNRNHLLHNILFFYSTTFIWQYEEFTAETVSWLISQWNHFLSKNILWIIWMFVWYNVEFCTSQTLWSHFTLVIHVSHHLTIVTNQTISGLMEEVTAGGSIMKINDCLTQNSSPPSVELHRRLKSNAHKLQWRAACERESVTNTADLNN